MIYEKDLALYERAFTARKARGYEVIGALDLVAEVRRLRRLLCHTNKPPSCEQDCKTCAEIARTLAPEDSSGGQK